MKQFVKIPGFLILVCITLIECKKEEVFNQGKLLQMVIVPGGDSTLYTMFTYDENNRLVAFKDSTAHYGIVNHQVFYNAHSNLAKCITQSQGSLFQRIDTFFYNGADRLTRRITNGEIETNFTYDEKGRLISDTGRTYGSTDYGFDNYEYDSHGDLVRWSRQHTERGVLYINEFYTAAYSDNINPYVSLGLNYFLIRDDLSDFLSAHERLSRSLWGAITTSYSYEFYPDGLLKFIYYSSPPSYDHMPPIEFHYQ